MARSCVRRIFWGGGGRGGGGGGGISRGTLYGSYDFVWIIYPKIELEEAQVDSCAAQMDLKQPFVQRCDQNVIYHIEMVWYKVLKVGSG